VSTALMTRCTRDAVAVRGEGRAKLMDETTQTDTDGHKLKERLL